MHRKKKVNNNAHLRILIRNNESLKEIFLTEGFAKSNAQGELISTPATNEGKQNHL